MAARDRARQLFLDDANVYGCSETAFITLKEAFRLPDAADSSAAMALNGGVAYSGGICGAISGSALAVGLLAGRRTANHARAKRTARQFVARLVSDFEAEFGSVDCRTLIGRDIRTPEGHAAFIESGVWRTVCMRQIEFAVERLAVLATDEEPAAAAEPGR
jgi:C_GCAxxG_C_C family probable redox protein